MGTGYAYGMLLVALLSCYRPLPSVDDDTGVDGTGTDSVPTDTDTDSGTTAPDPVELPALCEEPTTLAVPPLTMVGRDGRNDPRGGFVELLDVELDGDIAWSVGQGGLLPVDISDPASPRVLFFNGSFIDRLHRVEVLDGGWLAATHRDRGLTIVDVGDPSDPSIEATLSAVGWEGLAARGDRLYVTGRDDGLVTVDVSDPRAPVVLSSTPGLDAPWEIADAGDDWLYVADGGAGIVPVNVSDPDAPVVEPPVALPGSAFHAVVEGDWIYVAAGGDGVVVLDRSDPAAPVVVATVPTGGTAVGVAVGGSWLYVADHVGVAVLDLADPGAPTHQSRVSTEQFALAVAADEQHAFVADWNWLEAWELTPSPGAPALGLATDALAWDDGVATARLTNYGGAPLNLVGATSTTGQPVMAGVAVLAPGEGTTLTVEGSGDATLCLATDDPYEPVRQIGITDGGLPPVGQVAPDFALTDLDGQTWRLSEWLGEPIFITFFATW